MARWAAGTMSGSLTMMTMTFLERLGVQWMAMECAIAANVPEFLKLTNHYLDNTIYFKV